MKFHFISIRVIILLLVGSVQPVPVQSQASFATLQTALQQELNNIVEQNDLPGMTMAVVFYENQKINLAAGFSNIEEQRKMLPTTRMFSGSVGKVFVSALVLKLIDENKLSLDDHLSKFFGQEDWFKSLPNAQDIQLVNLLNHTSGLPRYIFQEAFLKDLRSDLLADRSPLECLAYIFNTEPLHAVGKDWDYSDTNYIMLGLILEKIMGSEYHDILGKDILRPFELSLTEPSLGRVYSNLAQGYVGSNNPFGLPDKMLQSKELVMNPAFEWTGGGVVTNVLDIARFVKNIHESPFLSHATKKLLTSAVSMTTGQAFDQGYGLGTFVWSKKNDTRYGHGGFFPGYLTHVEYSSKRQYSLAIQINTDERSDLLQTYIYQLDAVIDEYLDQLDKDQILKNFERQENCWNNQDMKCYMQQYAKDSTIQTISRAGVSFGYDNILKDYQSNWPPDRMGKLHFDQFSFRRMAEDIFFVTGRFNLDLPNREEPFHGWFSVNLKKINGKWMMITDHSS